MRIPKPTRRTVGKPLRFWAVCPACASLLACDEGVWPAHEGVTRVPGAWVEGGWGMPVLTPAIEVRGPCSVGGTRHESLEVKHG